MIFQNYLTSPISSTVCSCFMSVVSQQPLGSCDLCFMEVDIGLLLPLKVSAVFMLLTVCVCACARTHTIFKLNLLSLNQVAWVVLVWDWDLGANLLMLLSSTEVVVQGWATWVLEVHNCSFLNHINLFLIHWLKDSSEVRAQCHSVPVGMEGMGFANMGGRMGGGGM